MSRRGTLLGAGVVEVESPAWHEWMPAIYEPHFPRRNAKAIPANSLVVAPLIVCSPKIGPCPPFGTTQRYDRGIAANISIARFTRAIATAGKRTIMADYHAYGGAKPPPIDHQGIDDMFEGKASTIHYNYRGRWIELQGAD